MDTLSYWLSRLEPVIRAEAQGEIIVVLANRCGIEDEAVYAGTSAVLGLNAGEVKVYGILGRGEKELLVVDTSERAHSILVSESNSTKTTVDPLISQDTTATSPNSKEFPASYDDDIYSPVSPIDSHSNAQFFSKSYREQAFESAIKSQTLSNSKPSAPSPSPFSTNSAHSALSESDNFHRPTESTQPEVKTLEESKEKNDQPAEKAPDSRRRDSAIDTEKNEKPTNQEHATNAQQHAAPPGQADSTFVAPSILPQLDQSGFSYTQNDLGPRSRHISPRPQSTMW